jgi:nucleoid DNA-binding protein
VQNINFHIAYLLTKHECVIIPGFGAFIVSETESKNTQAGLLCVPVHSLCFNSEIKHNDGILASFISKNENSSYKEACLRVRQYADYLNSQLSAGRPVHIQRVGRLSLSAEQKISFIPARYLSCNADSFGLSNFYISPLRDVERYYGIPALEKRKKRKKDLIYIPVDRQIARWAGSIAAAVLALFLISTPLNEYSTGNLQQAGFFSLPVKTVETPLETEESLVLSPSASEECPSEIIENDPREK